MLIDEQEKGAPKAPDTEASLSSTPLSIENKKKLKVGVILGASIFGFMILLVIILAATASTNPIPPKPKPVPYFDIYNPFRILYVHEENRKLLQVSIMNNRTAIQKEFAPKNLQGIVVKNTTENPEPNVLKVAFTQLDEHMLNVRYNDPEWERWTVPDFGHDVDPYEAISKQIRSPLSVGIAHKESNIFEWSFHGKVHDIIPLITTENCRFQFYDKFIEFEARVQTDYIYGMGERLASFRLKNGNYSLWNRDLQYEPGKDPERGMYGSHPFFLNRLKDKKDFIGVFMKNSNAMLFSFWHSLNNGTYINYKMVGGIIDLYIIHATDPDYILKKYHSLIGRPYLPPVWAMGFQQARRGYSLNDLKDVLKGYQDAKIPVDALWADIDINSNYKTFTVDSSKYQGIKEFVQHLHDPHDGVDMRFVAIANPGLKKEVGYKHYDEAIKKNCLIHSAVEHEQPYEGKTMAGTTVWIDYFLRDGNVVWTQGLHDYRELTDFDGIWISENEISNLCDGECKKLSEGEEAKTNGDWIPNPFHNASEFDYIPFRPTLERLETSTLPMAAYQCCDNFFYKQYFTHNLFGLQTSKSTFEALHGIFEDKRFLVASRSTWPGSGHYSSHWLGDNFATWESMAASIPGILNFNLFGIPHVGAPIGGYIGNVDKELLARWYELGCFYPLMLSYSSSNANKKEAYAIPEITETIKRAMLERYGLLRFMYTKMFEAFAWGGPVVHPLFFEFPEDEGTFNDDVTDRTFMWGKTLYVIPTLIHGQTTVGGYLPNWRWYDLRTMEMVVDYKEGHVGSYHQFEQPLGHITVLIKGGAIIPYQRGATEARVMNVEDLKLISAFIIVAPDHTGKASGTMVVDADGIRPHPNPQSHTYRHYSFTYMNNIFRINKLAGFDFHEEHEFDYFYDLIILDVFGQHSIEFACMMNTDFGKKELEFRHVINTMALSIHDSNMAKIPMFKMESIVWGTAENYDFCKFQVHLQSMEYTNEEKGIVGELATSDPAAYQLKFDLKLLMLNNGVISLEIIKNEHGRYPWIVPDVVDDNVRKNSKASISIKRSGFKLSNIGDPFFFELGDPDDSFDFIFTTRNMPFVYVKDFIHFKYMVNSRHIFGLGERIQKFELADGLYSMFNYDQFSEETGIAPGNNLYGSHAFYLMHLHNPSHFAGMFFLNSNPVDIKIKHVGMQTQIDHVLVGGIIDAFIFQRGSVDEIIKNYQYVIGKPEPLPYWAFGYHQSRWGYRDIEHLRDVVTKFELANMPLDAIWMDKDYMVEYKIFTVDSRKWHGLQQFVQDLKSKGVHFVAIVDAGIAIEPGYRVYDDGLERGVYLNSMFTQKPLVGITWPGYSVWVDFLHPAAEQFWEEELLKFHEQIPYDGLWLDMNEPSNMCDGECPDEAHYIFYQFPIDFYDDLYYNPTHRGLEKGTISMEALHYGSTQNRPEFNYHNLFGYMQSRATARFFYARLRKRPFIISSSTFPGIGKFASHWLGDNVSSWHMMEYSIAGMMNFQLFGIPFVGADICGFTGNSSMSLCSRWMQLGAFYPFMRNHNSPQGSPQEPYIDPQLASISRKAIHLRYSLVRYIYSDYMHIVLEGGMLVKPLLFEFPKDPETYKILDESFMFGHAIRVTPVLEDKTGSLTSYFPNHDWYDFNTFQKVVSYNHSTTRGVNLTMTCSLDSEKINLHIKAGSIFPYQEQAIANNIMRIKQMTNLTAKLIVVPDHEKKAKGHLFYDDDENINIWSKDFHDVHLQLNNNEIKFIFEDGKKSFNYNNKDNIFTHVQILGASHYGNTVCAKWYDNVDKTFRQMKYTTDSAKDILTLEPQEGATFIAPRIDSISWHNTTC